MVFVALSLYASLLAIVGINAAGFEVAKVLTPILGVLAVLLVFVVLIREPLSNYLQEMIIFMMNHRPTIMLKAALNCLKCCWGCSAIRCLLFESVLLPLSMWAFFMAFQTLAVMAQMA